MEAECMCHCLLTELQERGLWVNIQLGPHHQHVHFQEHLLSSVGISPSGYSGAPEFVHALLCP